MSLLIAEKPLPAVAGVPFKIVSDFAPAGDQPQAIDTLADGLGRVGLDVQRRNAAPSHAVVSLLPACCATTL